MNNQATIDYETLKKDGEHGALTIIAKGGTASEAITFGAILTIAQMLLDTNSQLKRIADVLEAGQRP